MTITVAGSAGFCFGVDRAVRMVQSELGAGKRVATLGESIHNPQIVAEFRLSLIHIGIMVAEAAKLTSSICSRRIGRAWNRSVERF